MGAAVPFAFQDNAEVARRFPDLHPAFDSNQALTEANRCLNCFDAPCAAACPTHIDVPRFIKKIASDNLHDVARITGFLRGPALTEQMSSIDAVVMPSTWEETAGLSAIEQMMRGRLVIASDIGGLDEIVADAGLKFSAGDAATLANQMKKVIQHTSEVSTLAKAAQARAHSLFLADRMTADHASSYLKLS